jgi:hypothetical protein
MSKPVPLRPLCALASISVVALLLISDFGAGPSAQFSELEPGKEVEVYCTAIKGSEGAKGLMLEIKDSDDATWKAFCPHGTYPDQMVFPHPVRIWGRTSEGSPGMIFVERLELLS